MQASWEHNYYCGFWDSSEPKIQTEFLILNVDLQQIKIKTQKTISGLIPHLENISLVL